MKSKCLPLFLGALALLSLSVARAQDYTPKPGYTVLLELQVKADGTVEEVKILDSDDETGDAVLQRAAAGAAFRIKLPVREKDGKPVAYKAQAPIYFPVDGDEGLEANNAPKPKIRTAPQIVYPAGMAEKGIVGGAILELIIGANGNISSTKLMRASHPEFATAAVEGVKHWSFVPALKNNEPVESRWRVAITFATDMQDADWMWRVAPRPSLGSYTVVRRVAPIPAAPAAPTGLSITPPAAPAPEKK